MTGFNGYLTLKDAEDVRRWVALIVDCRPRRYLEARGHEGDCRRVIASFARAHVNLSLDEARAVWFAVSESRGELWSQVGGDAVQALDRLVVERLKHAGIASS